MGSKAVIALTVVVSIGACLAAPRPASGTEVVEAQRDAVVSPFGSEGGGSELQARRALGLWDQESLVGFDLPEGGPLRRATLRLHATRDTVDAVHIRRVESSWSESSVTWATRPVPVGGAVQVGSVRRGEWVAVDVTALVPAGGAVDFAIEGSPWGTAGFGSRESAAAPQLEVVRASGADGVVDVAVPGPVLERRLQGYHTFPQPSDAGGLDVRMIRGVVSYGDGFRFDCDAMAITPAARERFDAWADAVQAQGAEPMAAISYVPECIARGGNPKAPPTDPAVYAAYLTQVLKMFVSDRIASGREPVTWFEAWNEPDTPLGLADTPAHGHGFVGTLDEYVDAVFGPFMRAAAAEEERSATALRIGVAATLSGTRFGDIVPDMGAFGERLLGIGPLAANLLFRPLTEALLRFVGSAAEFLDAGGFAWPDRLVAEAAAGGRPVDFVSWHTYADNPLQGPGAALPTGIPPALAGVFSLLARANPVVTPAQYRTEARAYRARYPGKTLALTEWEIGTDGRDGTVDAAAFHAAALTAMQEGGLDIALVLGTPNGPEHLVHEWFDRLGSRTVAVTPEDPGDESLWVLATGDRSGAALLVSQWRPIPGTAVERDVVIDLAGLPPGTYAVTISRVDAVHPDGTVEHTTLEVGDDAAAFALDLPGAAAALVEITPMG